MFDRARDALFRVFRFAGGNADELRALEGETGDEEDAENGEEFVADAVAEEGGVADGKVGEADVCAAKDAEDGQGTDGKEDDDGKDFDKGEPVFRLAIGFHREEIERGDEGKEDDAPAPGRQEA